MDIQDWLGRLLLLYGVPFQRPAAYRSNVVPSNATSSS